MRIANNIPALTTSITLKSSDREVVEATRRLSTGSRISSARYDAAGLAIANKLSSQVTGLNRASQNSMDGVSLIQTADGSLNEVTNIIQRMRELAVQAANGVLEPADKNKIQLEVNQLVQEINENATRTEFNKIKILSGESDTLTESFTGATPPDPGNGYAAVLYASPALQPGFLNYTIKSPGFPAEAVIDPSMLLGSDMVFTLNEVSVSISALDTIDNIRGKLTDAADLASLEIKFDTNGKAYFATRIAGSSQAIAISSATMPMPWLAKNENGTDAELDNVKYLDLAGKPVADFNTGASVRSDGNMITIASTRGQSIRLGLKVFFSPENGTGVDFTYDNGKPVGADVDMVAQVKNYGPLYLQIGPNFNQDMMVKIPRLDAETLGFIEYTGGEMKVTLDFQSIAGATRAMGVMDKALSDVMSARSWIGAYQNRLEQTVMNLDSAAENMESARSRLQDTDMAAAMTEYTQFNIKYQAGIAILAQANQRPQQILSLLQ